MCGFLDLRIVDILYNEQDRNYVSGTVHLLFSPLCYLVDITQRMRKLSAYHPHELCAG